MNRFSRLAALLFAAALSATATTQATEFNPVAHSPGVTTDDADLGVIVKLRSDTSSAAAQKLSSSVDRGAALAKRTGVALEFRREISGRMMSMNLASAGLSAGQALERLRADPEVEYAVPDHRRFPHDTTPNDTLFGGQWYLKFTEVSAVNAIGAWDTEQGSNGVVVAVLDTGVLYDHPDLGRGDHGGKLLPGFDFVSGTLQANDGDGRDADPSDPGDWINDSDKTNAAFANCDVSGSSWHGTRVSGMIGALTNNTAGVAGLSWNSFLLPVRVLGKCGGIDSDILAGMRWAAGLHVAGVPDNPTPARILNMSLGAKGSCEPSYRDVIQELTALKVLVVISAGNDGTVVASPGNCPGVAAIAAIRHAGSKVGFSNLGPEVTIAAPGGNCVNVNGGPCLFSLDTTTNSGTTGPGTNTFTDQTSSNLGTSFSAPIVSGVAALMLSQNNNLSTTQLLARLREGAREFPGVITDAPGILTCHVPANNQDFQLEQCLCTTDTCGAGMVNAANSVGAADRPIAAISVPSTANPGQNVNLSATASAAACGHSVASFAWTVTSPTSNPPPVSGAGTANATVVAPSSGSITLRLTVSDDHGLADSAEVVIGPSSVTTVAPASAGSTPCATAVTSGATPVPGQTPTPTPTPSPAPTPAASTTTHHGGGGSLELSTLTLLGVFAWRRRRAPCGAPFSRCI
jgi:serine protease